MSDIRIFHDSHSLEYRAPFGAVKAYEKVLLKILLDKFATVYINLNYFDGRKEKIALYMLHGKMSLCILKIKVVI